MPLYLEDQGRDAVFYADNASEPKMGYQKGQAWDTANISIDGETYEMFLETSYGNKGYFKYDGKWYSLDLNDLKRMPPLADDFLPIDLDSFLDDSRREYQTISRQKFLDRKDEKQPDVYD